MGRIKLRLYYQEALKATVRSSG